MRQLSTGELSGWLADTNRSSGPLLVDARSAEEFAVSHLRDALHFVSVDQLKGRLAGNSQPVIVYCSMGYRSSAVAEKLQKAGVTNVWNLEGSLFAWANEGRPVYRGTTLLAPAVVHPYDSKWGKLLKSECRAVLK